MNKDIVMQNFTKWNDALLTKDPKTIANLYTDDATFLPTMSEEFKKGVRDAESYFIRFVAKDPTGTIIEEETQTLSDNCYLHSGIYDFEVGPKADRYVVHARFSFVWQKDDLGEWKIIHHHSSARPNI